MTSARPRPHAVYLASDWPYPPTSGGRSHAAALARHLGHHVDVTVLAADMPSSSDLWAQAVARSAARRARPTMRGRDFVVALAKGTHVVLERACRADLPLAFEEIVRDRPPTFVVLARPFFGPFLDVARAAGSRVVIDADESMSRVAASIARAPGALGGRLRAAVEVLALERFERREFPRADQVWVTSTVEKSRLSRYMDMQRIRVIPNVAPRPVDDLIVAPAITAVAFVGWYGYGPNEAAAMELIRDVMPRIRDLGGPHRLVLIGRDPTQRMKALASADGATEVTGELEDVGNALRAAGVLVCPIRSGGGTRVKILDAAALGVPVVSTSRGVEGLDFKDGREVLVADDVDTMARAVLRLSLDSAERQDLAEHAAKAVRDRWSEAAADTAVADALDAAGGSPR